MWTDFSVKYIKSNKVSSAFLAVISFLASVFLTLLSTMAYNMWVDHVNQIIAAEGSYTSRPEPLVAAYAFVMIAAVFSLIFMIHNAFEVPMNARMHQLGILQGVGASPKQIRHFLVQECVILCTLPVVLGTICGVALSYLLMQFIIHMTKGIPAYEVRFYLNGGVTVLSFLASAVTILISSWIPAVKLSKIAPLEAIAYGTETEVKKMHKYRLFSGVFGVYGELARKSIYARRKQLRTSSVSLAFAFIALTGLLNIEAISQISTKYTYFERYRDKWDMRIETDSYDQNVLPQILKTENVAGCIAYRMAETTTAIEESKFSAELQNAGITNLNSGAVRDADGKYAFKAPVYILDDASYHMFCQDNGMAENGVSAINTIWNSVNSSRKFREYMPIVSDNELLSVKLGETLVTILDFAREMPVIKEEYEQYSFSIIMSDSYYKGLSDCFSITETHYNLFLIAPEAYEPTVQKIMSVLEDSSAKLTGELLESRVEEENQEYKLRNGLRLFVIGFAAFLALIGLVNIFSFTLGQIFQRKKEFARYFTVGLSIKGMRKILTMEALIICLRPLLLSLIISVPLVTLALSAADISFREYIGESPALPVSVFTVVVFLLIAFAYYLGGKKICSSEYVETIKDETLV